MKAVKILSFFIVLIAICNCTETDDTSDVNSNASGVYTIVEGYLTYGAYNYASDKKILVSMSGGIFSGGTTGSATTDANGYYIVKIPCNDYVGETRTIYVNYQPPNSSYASKQGYTSEFTLGSRLRVDLNYDL